MRRRRRSSLRLRAAWGASRSGWPPGTRPTTSSATRSATAGRRKPIVKFHVHVTFPTRFTDYVSKVTNLTFKSLETGMSRWQWLKSSPPPPFTISPRLTRRLVSMSCDMNLHNGIMLGIEHVCTTSFICHSSARFS